MPTDDAARAKKREQNRRWYLANREVTIARAKAWAEAHPEERRAIVNASDNKRRAKRQAYVAANRERIYAANNARNALHRAENVVRAQAWYAEHRENRSTYNREYRLAHPEKDAAHRIRRRAAKANAPVNDFTADQWREMQEVFNHCCAYCGRRAKGHLTQDHVTPLSKGGSHTLSNVVPACHTCNTSKRTGPPPSPVQPLLLTTTKPKTRVKRSST